MAIKILSNGVETRKAGYTPSGAILAGQPVKHLATDTTGATIMVAAGGSVIGFALESTVAPLTMNVYYDDYNRGGLVSYVTGNGVEIEVWNDGRGNIFDPSVTFTMDQPVYSTAEGLISNVVLGNQIGVVTKVPFSATDSLKIQITM